MKKFSSARGPASTLRQRDGVVSTICVMSSNSEDGSDGAGKEHLYLNSDDSVTTLNDEGQGLDEASNTEHSQKCVSLTWRCPSWEAASSEGRLTVLLLAWTLFLYRGSLSEEPLSYSWNVATVQSDKATATPGQVRSLSAYIAGADEQVSSARKRIQDLEVHFDVSDEQLIQGLILEALSSSGSDVEVVFGINVSISAGLVKLSVKDRPKEMAPEMALVQAGAFLDLLDAVTSNTDQAVNTLLPPRERELSQILDWGSTVPPTISRGMQEYFSEHARDHPEKQAIVSWDGQLSYGELEELSTNLAGHLANRGVKIGTAIPFCFEKSAWTVVAVLAVMKAGGTFVLTDPTQPEARLQTIVEEVRAQFVLTSNTHAELGARLAPAAEVIAVGPEFLRGLPHQDVQSLSAVPGSATMYIIFTSGSTGKPKGVMLSHENYTSGAIPRAEAVGYTSHTRVLDFASYAFDVSIDCMLCTLAVGGCICVPSNDQRMNNLSGAIRDMQVNMVHTTPSVARVLDADIIPSLEVLGLGGEALSARDAETWSQHTRVINAYGPSECTVGCAINNDIPPGRSYVSLGRGVGGVLWIVNPDNHNELAPIGSVGELLVEGPIVGLGYINEPEKTASVYIEDPMWLVRGDKDHSGRQSRLYKTGDLVRYDPDGKGSVVFVGRKDQQVKIRGQRVELGEVEHHLRSKLPPGTAVAAEVIKPGSVGDPMLVAFVAEHDEHQQATQEGNATFSASLQQTLAEMDKVLAVEAPVYMIPSAYVPMEELPIMVSGKTDRKQLRSIGSAMSRKDLAKSRLSSVQSKGAVTETQRILAQLWCTLLGEQEVNLDDSFFGLGGDSIKAMRLVTVAREQGLSLTVAAIFANPQLAGMASQAVKNDETLSREHVPPFSLLGSALSAENARAEAARLCNVSLDTVEDVLPCTPLQEILMAFSAKVKEAYVAQRVLKLADSAAATHLRTALKKTAAESPILRTRIVHLSNQGLVQVVLGDEVEIASGQNLDEYVRTDLDKATGLGDTLARFAIIDDEQTGYPHFVLTMHHALYDGWSMPLIVERLNRAHRGLDTHRAADFSAYIRYLTTMDRVSSETYWRQQLHGAGERQYPVRARPGCQPRPDSLLERYVPLGTESASTSTTVATAVRAAWALVSSELAVTDDVIFGETLTGRNAPVPGVEEIEGPMITTVPVRIRVDRTTKAADFLKLVHQQTVDRIPHEHFGLQGIRRASSDGRKVYSNMFAGLVLHPYVDKEANAADEDQPVSELVPVGDAEAAREALKFNSYAVMLVCTLDPKGIFIMASFDSAIVPEGEMQEALSRLHELIQQLSQPNGKLLSDLSACNSEVAPDATMNVVVEHNEPKKTNAITHDVSKDKRSEKLLQVWSRLLELDPADIDGDDSFFDLGGDSIAAMKLVSEMKQAGYSLTVAEIFSYRRLNEMAAILQQSKSPERNEGMVTPFAALDVEDTRQFVEDLRPALQDRSWTIEDVLPTRPLQEVAVNGTVTLPRYSARYELFYFDGPVDKAKLLGCCQQLVDRTEILRTVFIKTGGQCLAVVLKDLQVSVEEYYVDGEVEAFARQLCDLNVQTSMPLGSPFVKFLFVQGATGKSCLLFRISHAQYDEICLPIMLRQLSQLYEGKDVEVAKPFSSFVQHVLRENIPQGLDYWRELLKESQLTRLKPAIRLGSKSSVAVQRTIDISRRPKQFTLATFPTAAWSLCLAKRLGISDVTFGEVASGRNTSFDGADRVIGPCWQYIPFRMRFEAGWAASDLLRAVQQQHISSGQFEGIGLTEVVEHCTDWPRSTDWFDSVVHQDVAHVEELSFSAGNSRMETIYPHLEPLREWKIQAFKQGDEMTLEVVTYESWKGYAESLLVDLTAAFEQLIECSPDQSLL